MNPFHFVKMKPFLKLRSLIYETCFKKRGRGERKRYFHLQEFFVEEGDIVKKGEVIAAMGASGIVTGPALGLSVTVDGESIKPAITDEEYAKPRVFESEE